MANNRLKDYYDLWILGEEVEFDGPSLVKAFKGTFERRRTGVPSKVPIGLSGIYHSNKKKKTDWRAFLKKHGLNKSRSLETASNSIIALAMPVAEAQSTGAISFEKTWKNGAWTDLQAHTIPDVSVVSSD